MTTRGAAGCTTPLRIHDTAEEYGGLPSGRHVTRPDVVATQREDSDGVPHSTPSSEPASCLSGTSSSDFLRDQRLRRANLVRCEKPLPAGPPTLMARVSAVTAIDEQISYVERHSIRASAGWQPRR